MKQELQEELAKAFDEDLADAVFPFTCTKNIYSGQLDFKSQTYPIIGVETYSSRGVLFGSYQKDIVKPTDYQVTDSKATILQNKTLKDGVEHKLQIGDIWETPKGLFRVVNIGVDPVDATWVCQLRKV